MKIRNLELLAPAANAEVAIQAILHGADAVYMGASSHGARKSAANPIADVARVVEFAHQFHSRVYVTVNTIVYENELKTVEKLCHELYKIGVDALIVQDMALLRMNLPPIELHASTQCDIRTMEKARFLQDVGFSQLVLARELTLQEIKSITENVNVPVECFVHGALCVSYSGKCHASFAATKRSANRGECAQLCRLPYTLRDANGKVISRDKHLLSLRDFNASYKLAELIDSGVDSFKIEGRLKDVVYVKNIVAYYRRLLDDIISKNSDKYRRNSFGRSEILFEPNPEKSFNRGFTEYFLSGKRPASIASLGTPKSMGEIIRDISSLHNGDGISFFDKNGIYQGVNVNNVDRGRIITRKMVDIPKGAEIHRTYDMYWQKKLSKESAVRKIGIKIALDFTGITASDERGNLVRLLLDVNKDKARNPMDYKDEFSKLGNTIYKLESYESKIPSDVFIPRSELASIRRKLIELLDISNSITYHYKLRRQEDKSVEYPLKNIDYRENVANSAAERFYHDHGVVTIENAMEVEMDKSLEGSVVMTTRHCVLRELEICKKNKGKNLTEPLILSGGGRDYLLKFNCIDCEMQVAIK